MHPFFVAIGCPADSRSRRWCATFCDVRRTHPFKSRFGLVPDLRSRIIGSACVGIPLIGSSLSFFQKADQDAFYVALILVPLNTLAAVLQSQLAGFKEYGRIAVYSFIRVATNALALVFFVYVLKLGVHGALAAVGVASLAMVICSTRYLVVMWGLRYEPISSEAFRKLIRYGIRFYVARIGWGVDVRIGTLLLGVLASKAGRRVVCCWQRVDDAVRHCIEFRFHRVTANGNGVYEGQARACFVLFEMLRVGNRYDS